MKIPKMIAAEFRRLTSSTMAIVALIALMCVPILYAGLYLWANQNPYAKLSQIPAAVVVDDTGATVNGKTINYGAKVADQLVKEGTFDWHRVSATTASKGIHNSTYDFSITFPAGFSSDLASSSTATPTQARVTLTTNDANSYLSTTIGQQAAAKIRTSIVQTVNQQAASQFLLAFSTIHGQLSKAVDGANQLVDGSAAAASGAGTLASGTSQLAAGASQLAAGTSQVAAGAQQVANGNAQLASKASQAGAVANQAAASVPAVRQDVIDRLTAAGASEATIDQVLAALDPLGAQVTAGNAQVQTLVGQVNALSAGANQVAGGAAASASGAASVSSGAAQSAAGAQSLATGLTTLQTGATTLRDGLTSGLSQIPNSDKATRDKQAATIADPVSLQNSSVTSAGTYGAGLAPFFISLSAWIGIYALFLIIKPVSRRAITALHSPVKVTLAGWLTPGLFGAVQMIGVFVIVAWVLHFSISNPLATFGMMAMASLTFAAMILALNVWLGSVGQFLGLVLMVVQLVTAGGTFPWQTLPAPLAALHHILPMSYAVEGIRQLMYGGNYATALTDLGVLALWLGIALLVAAIGVIRMTHFRTLRDLRPSLIG